MANGDVIDSVEKRGTYESTDGTAHVLASIVIPTATDCLVAIFAWAHGKRESTSPAEHADSLIGCGSVDGAAFSLNGQASLGAIELSSSGYVVALGQTGGTLELRVTGATAQTVRWHGRLRVELTEQTLSGG